MVFVSMWRNIYVYEEQNTNHINIIEMIRKILLLFLVIGVISCKKDKPIAKLGETVPNYTFKNILNSQETEISLKDLKGKVVILEFWATWCGSCIPAIKKLDSLQQIFKNNIEIITISSEKKERLQNFIKSSKTTLKIVAADTIHHETFKYRFIPHSIIIDKNGVVRAITDPEKTTKDVIKKLIENNEISLALKDDFYVNPNVVVKNINSVIKPDYRIELKSFNPKKRCGLKSLKGADGKVNGVEIMNLTIPGIYRDLFQIASSKRIVYRDSLTKDDFPYDKEHQYNLIIQYAPQCKDKWRELGIAFLNENFDVNARMSVDTLDCYVIKNIDDKNKIKESKSKTSEYMFMGTILKAKRIKMSQLAEYLESFTPVPVLDKTNLKGYYDIELEWQSVDVKTLYAELKKYGVKLVKSKKKLPVEVMEIYKKKK